MKKILLFACAMFLAGFGIANAEIEITVENMNQPANDTLLFAMPETPGCDQEIWTYGYYQNPITGNETEFRVMKFQAEYLVTALDFTHGDVNKGTANLPANAKVIGLALNGYDSGSDVTNKGIFHEVTAWCKNIDRSEMTLHGLDLFDGYLMWPEQGDLFTDTVTYRGYKVITDHPGVVCTFDPTANADNPCPIVEIPFGNPTDPSMPFWYKGENIYLTLWLCNWFDVHMKYHYMAYDQAEAEYASLMRSSNYCFSSESQYDCYDYFGQDLPYELPTHRLPAFRTPYYTNDIRVALTELDAVLTLKDSDGNVIPAAEDGNYYSLDHTKTYELFVDSYTSQVIEFTDIYSDVFVSIKKNMVAVDEINASKTVANVAYYNLAGQKSAQPVDGVNIVVTTYTDGTRTTAKVIK